MRRTFLAGLTILLFTGSGWCDDVVDTLQSIDKGLYGVGRDEIPPQKPVAAPRRAPNKQSMDEEAPPVATESDEPSYEPRRAEGWFIRNRLSGKCIDVNGTPGTGNGSGLQLWDCEYYGGPNGTPTDQRWIMTKDKFIKNTLSNKCIDVNGAPGTANGNGLQLWDCEYYGGPNGTPTDQKWLLTKEGFIKNELSKKCIDVNGAPGTSNGARLQLWDCEYYGGPNGTPTDQKWEWVKEP